MFKKIITTAAVSSLLLAGNAMAADYQIDKEGQHAFVNFKVSHLGFSYIYGSFNDFNGSFSYDAAKPEAAKINVSINTNSVDTNHADRDKHLRSPDFLNTKKHGEAKFVSTSIKKTGDKTLDVTGDFTLNGVTKSIVINANVVGEGKDPWGGYRAGFEGSTSLSTKEFKIKMAQDMGIQSVDIFMSFEGVRK